MLVPVQFEDALVLTIALAGEADNMAAITPQAQHHVMRPVALGRMPKLVRLQYVAECQ